MEADPEGGDPGALNSDQKNPGSASYAQILGHIGEFGRWQQLIFLWSEFLSTNPIKIFEDSFLELST